MSRTPSDPTTPRLAPKTNPLTYDEAAQMMWIYYRDHKHLLYSHVRDAREAILKELQAGKAVEEVFAPYTRLPNG